MINSIKQSSKPENWLVFLGFSIFVACIGLVALAAYITSVRTKEIGVRKVLRAFIYQSCDSLSKYITRNGDDCFCAEK